MSASPICRCSRTCKGTPTAPQRARCFTPRVRGTLGQIPAGATHHQGEHHETSRHTRIPRLLFRPIPVFAHYLGESAGCLKTAALFKTVMALDSQLFDEGFNQCKIGSLRTAGCETTWISFTTTAAYRIAPVPERIQTEYLRQPEWQTFAHPVAGQHPGLCAGKQRRAVRRRAAGRAPLPSERHRHRQSGLHRWRNSPMCGF